MTGTVLVGISALLIVVATMIIARISFRSLQKWCEWNEYDPCHFNLQLTAAERQFANRMAHVLPQHHDVVACMYMYNNVQEDLPDSERAALEYFAGYWSMEACGRIRNISARLPKMPCFDLPLDRGFLEDAVHNLNLLYSHGKIASAFTPHVHATSGVYRLLWHRGRWYLSGGPQETYRAAVLRVKVEWAVKEASRICEKT